MSCHEWESAFEDGLASPQFRAHLQTCAACATADREQLRLTETLHTMARSIPSDPAFWSAQRRKIMQQVAPVSAQVWHPIRWLSATAVMGLIIFGIVTHQSSRKSDTLVPPSVEFLQHMDMMEDLDILEKWNASANL